MKKYLLGLAIIFGLLSCSSDGTENEESQPHVDYSPLGVWETGKYFLVFGNGNFFIAYLDDDFIDSGNYEYNEANMRVSCRNPYFNTTSTYDIISCEENSLTVSVIYHTFDGTRKQKGITFKKSLHGIGAIDKWTLKDRTWSEQWWHNGEECYSTTTITNYNEGLRTTEQADAKEYPLSLFYICFDNTMFYQIFNTKENTPAIQGWNTDAGTGKVFEANVSIK